LSNNNYVNKSTLKQQHEDELPPKKEVVSRESASDSKRIAPKEKDVVAVLEIIESLFTLKKSQIKKIPIKIFKEDGSLKEDLSEIRKATEYVFAIKTGGTPITDPVAYIGHALDKEYYKKSVGLELQMIEDAKEVLPADYKFPFYNWLEPEEN
jgi:hypothetical protein